MMRGTICICTHMKVGLTPDGGIVLHSYVRSTQSAILWNKQYPAQRPASSIFEKSGGVRVFHLSGQLDGNPKLTGSSSDKAHPVKSGNSCTKGIFLCFAKINISNIWPFLMGKLRSEYGKMAWKPYKEGSSSRCYYCESHRYPLGLHSTSYQPHAPPQGAQPLGSFVWKTIYEIARFTVMLFKNKKMNVF